MTTGTPLDGQLRLAIAERRLIQVSYGGHLLELLTPGVWTTY